MRAMRAKPVYMRLFRDYGACRKRAKRAGGEKGALRLPQKDALCALQIGFF